MERIPVALPDLTGNEEAYVVEAIQSTWISSSGKFVDRFETEFASLTGSAQALSVCNGTVALHLALLALDVRPGDEILVPSLTYIATANAVRYVGGTPVFVEVDPDNWCIDPTTLEDYITPRTKGIIAVHLYGHPADMDAINHVAAVHGLWVVEDAAEAHFATYKGRPTGGLAQIGTFSFYGNKIITSGEGGAVTVQDHHLAVRMRTLRGQGMDPERRYYFPVIGYNFRLTNVACAMLCAQLERRQELTRERQRVFDRYFEHLKDIPGLGFQRTSYWAVPTPWLFSMTVDEREFGMDRDSLMTFLDRKGIETRPFFVPLHRLPPFREQAEARRTILQVTDRLGDSGMNLPTFTQLSNDTIDYVVSSVREARR